jgi:hypothetical protein
MLMQAHDLRRDQRQKRRGKPDWHAVTILLSAASENGSSRAAGIGDDSGINLPVGESFPYLLPHHRSATPGAIVAP